jgi:nucleotide-binding universal stress UspA family protein
MKNLLVPCDFTQTAINAFRFALSVAAQSQGNIHLVHSIELPVVVDPLLAPMGELEESYRIEMKAKVDKAMTGLVSRYNKENIPVSKAVLYGLPTQNILTYARENDIDMIIMGSHGASGLRDMMLGSNAEKVVRRASIPVLVVKDMSLRPIRDIVFATSLNIEDSEALVEHVKELQAFFDAQLHLVWINTPEHFTSDTLTNKAFDKFVRHYGLHNYTARIYNDVNEEEGILAFARSINADLIAMGTHGRTGLQHLFMGSITGDVVNHSHRMVWTYPVKKSSSEAKFQEPLVLFP